ncbi:MAG: DVUA0089 family protein, partial [Planctomycetales bacterium]|nr:DVUA0089 family protein [Planctomycetales bacterium]
MSVNGTNDDGTSDFYSVEVNNAGDRGIFDVDFGSKAQEAELVLYDPNGNFVASHRDTSDGGEDPGSAKRSRDPYLDVLFPTSGIFVVEVRRTNGHPLKYRLNVSIENHSIAPGQATNDYSSGDLDIRKTITIVGAGPDTIIDAKQIDRVFDVHPGAWLDLNNLTVTGGFAAQGGGIQVRPGGTAYVRRVQLEENFANEGGGIGNEGSISVYDSAIEQNTAFGKGGAVFDSASGFTSVYRTLIDSNRTDNQFASAIRSEGWMYVFDSTITGHNQSAGVTMVEVGNFMSLRGTTISENGDNQLVEIEPGALIEVINSTIAHNTSIDAFKSFGEMRIGDSLIVGNNGSDITLAGGTLFSWGHNLLSSVSASVQSMLDPSDRIQSNAIAFLAPLADNGGPTMTLLPLDGSLAIDGGRVSGGRISEVEPNNSRLNAQSLEESPWLGQIDNTPNVPFSSSRPHVTVQGRGDGTFDYYRFTNSYDNNVFLFDIDVDRSNGNYFDSQLFVFDQFGSLIAENDDSPVADEGSTATLDSYLEVTLAAGDYVVAVGQYSSQASNGELVGAPPRAGIEYTLHVVAELHDSVWGFGGDQRGFIRPQDGDGDGVSVSDIGAIEKTNGSIEGILYLDLDQDRVRDPNEPGIEGRTVYLDRNQNGEYDLGETFVTTSGDDPSTADFIETGRYRFDGITPGTVSVSQVLTNQFVATETGFGGLERSSLREDGSESSFGSFGPSLSGDGRFVVYAQFRNAEGSEVQYLLKDRQRDVIQLLPVPEGETGVGDGTQISGDGSTLIIGEAPSISDDGNLVTYVTRPIAPAVGVADIYLYNRSKKSLTKVSVPINGTEANGDSSEPQISADGNYITFTSDASDLVSSDFNGASDVFRYEVATGALELVSVSNPAVLGGILADVEPNNTISLAQQTDNVQWSLASDGDITDSTSIPHLTVQGTGDGTFDYYAFTVSGANVRGIFDIDYGYTGVFPGSFDTELFLYDQTGTLLDLNDDAVAGDAGSDSSLDSFIDYLFTSPGTYVVAVGRFDSFPSQGGVSGNAPDYGDTYVLHLSVEGHSLSQINPASYHPSISGDGSVITFASLSSNLIENDTNGLEDVFYVALTEQEQQANFVFNHFEREPNDGLSHSQNIDVGRWSLGPSFDITESDVLPHLSVEGSGDGTFDYYSFTVANPNSRGIFDIDYGVDLLGNRYLDTELFLYDSFGSVLAQNDDSNPWVVENGSTSGLESYLEYTFTDPGTYTIAVGRFNSTGQFGGVSGNPPQPGDFYVLQVSIEGHSYSTS